MKTRERERRKKARVTTKWQSRHTHTLIYGICAQVLLKENWKTANERKEQKTLDRCEKCCPSPITGDANARARTQNVSIFVSIAIFFLILLFLRLMYFLRGVWKHCRINCEWKVRCHHRSMLWASTSLLCVVQSVSFGECVCLCVLRSMYRIVQSTESFSSEWIKPSVYDL